MIERETPSPSTVPDPPARADLDRLMRARGLQRYAYFFVTGEGTFFPDGAEESSGNVIDAHGRVFSFWTGWDAEGEEVTLRLWEQETPERRWGRSAEYRRARAAVGLPT